MLVLHGRAMPAHLLYCPNSRKNLPPTPIFFPKSASYHIISHMSNETGSDEDKTRLISLAEAAEKYGFDQRYLATLARKGRLQATKIGNSWVTTPQQIENFILSRQKRGVYRDDIRVD